MTQPSLLGSDFRLTAIVAGPLSQVSSLALAGGRALVTWTGGGQTVGRVFNADGTIDSAGSPYLNVDASAHSIADLPDGGFVIAFGSGTSAAERVYDRDGLERFGQFTSTDDTIVGGLKVATVGNEIVTSVRTTVGAYAEAIDTAGNVVQEVDDITLNNGSGPSTRDAAGQPWTILAAAGFGNGSLGALTLTRNTISLHLVNMASFTEGGAPIGVAFSPGIDATTVKMVKLPNGDVLATWRDGQTLNAAEYNAGGRLVTSFKQDALGEGTTFSVAPINGGNFLMTWTDKLIDSHEILGEVFDAGGHATSSIFLVNYLVAGDQTDPSAVQLGDGDILVTWNTANGSTIGVAGRSLSLTRPDAVNDRITAVAGATTSVTPLTNDTDPNGDSLALQAVGTAGHGTVTQVGNTIAYTPAAGFTGVDTFSYTLGNGHGLTDTAIVIASVRAPSVPAGDFDGDGHSDILWRNVDGGVSAWRVSGSPAGSTLTQNTYYNSVTPDWKIVGTADFTGDGHADILWRNDNGVFSIWNAAGGGFAPGSYTDGSVGTGWKIVGTGDTDGDGKADLLWRNDDGAISTWRSTGTGFAANAYYHGSVGTDWHVVDTFDFNGDGKADILWRQAGGAISVWNSTGAGFAENSYFDASVDNRWHIAAVGDFNGDGKDDLLWRNVDGAISIWQSTGTGFAKNVYYDASVPPSWHVAATGDFNADGKADILWHNDDGTLSTWESTGTAFSENVAAASVPTAWSIQGHDFLYG